LPGICQANDLLNLLYSPVWNGDFESLNTDPYDLDFSNQKSSKSFDADIDIYGWKNMTRINNTDYINGNITDNVYCFLYIKSRVGKNDTIDRIEKEIDISIDDDIIEDLITINYNLTFFWHSSELMHTETGKYYNKKYYTEKITGIKDHEVIPHNFSKFDVENCQAFITFYNNSIRPKTVIFLPKPDGSIYVEYKYKNESIKQNILTGHVEHNKNGIEFVNFTENFGWSKNDGNLSHVGKNAVIKGSNFSIDDFQIIAQTPYEKINITNYSTKKILVFNNKNPYHYVVIIIFVIVIVTLIFLILLFRILLQT